MTARKFELCLVITQGEVKGGGIYMGHYDSEEQARAAVPGCRKELLERLAEGRAPSWHSREVIETARVLVL